MTVRSTKLLTFVSAGSTLQATYHSPAGWRTIVKYVTAHQFGATAANVNVFVQDAATSAYTYLFNQSVASGATGSATTWLVLNPGDILQVNTDQANTGFWVSGTVLQLTGGEPI